VRPALQAHKVERVPLAEEIAALALEPQRHLDVLDPEIVIGG
jgi:hypothetical protein